MGTGQGKMDHGVRMERLKRRRESGEWSMERKERRVKG